MKFDYANRYKFNKNNKEDEIKVDEEIINIPEKVTEDAINEIVNTNDVISDTKVDEEIINIPEKVTEEYKEKYGKLINCELLNVRKEPDINSDIITVINKDYKIKILEELETFYKVLINNEEAYCMKKYINIE